MNDGPCSSHSLGKNSEIDFSDVSHQKKVKLFFFPAENTKNNQKKNGIDWVFFFRVLSSQCSALGCVCVCV